VAGDKFLFLSGRALPMLRISVRAGAVLLVAAALLLTAGQGTRADDDGDFDGKWKMNANGWTFVLKIEQDGDSFTGTMTGINNDQKSKVEGKIKGKKITFTRDNGQRYEGYLFVEDPSDKGAVKLGMAGVAVNGDDEDADKFGWYATR
jgi:hypothetical protein